MHSIILRLDPSLLDNPDLDIRHALPDLLAERSGGAIADDGYDYAGDRPYLVLFLRAADLARALGYVRDVVESEPVLGNDLRRAVVVAVQREGGPEVVYPAGFVGAFPC